MPRWEPNADIVGEDVEHRTFTHPDELPDESIILSDGRVLVPAEDHEAEFVENDDGFLYSTKTGRPVAEIDESDNDVGYETREEFDYDEDAVEDEDYDEYDEDEDDEDEDEYE
jgi:hypothetical protein